MKDNPMFPEVMFDSQTGADDAELNDACAVMVAVAEAVQNAVLRLRDEGDGISIRGILSGAVQGAISGVLSLMVNPADPTAVFAAPAVTFREAVKVIEEGGSEWPGELLGYWEAVADGMWRGDGGPNLDPADDPNAPSPERIIAEMIERGRAHWEQDH